MEYSCISDVGLLREKNEDSYLSIKNEYGDFLAIVADGIGGGLAGEVASGELVKYFKPIFEKSGPFNNLEDIKNFLNYHIDKANRLIYDLSLSNKNYSGMGTTMTGILIHDDLTLTFNVGDSRVYGCLDGKIIQLTRDHSLVNKMLDDGKITYEESLNHELKHYLVKAIGIYSKVKADINLIDKMDYYVICSDGLHGLLSENEMLNIIYRDISIDEKVIELKNHALLNGGYDNITVVLVKN